MYRNRLLRISYYLGAALITLAVFGFANAGNIKNYETNYRKAVKNNNYFEAYKWCNILIGIGDMECIMDRYELAGKLTQDEKSRAIKDGIPFIKNRLAISKINRTVPPNVTIRFTDKTKRNRTADQLLSLQNVLLEALGDSKGSSAASSKIDINFNDRVWVAGDGSRSGAEWQLTFTEKDNSGQQVDQSKYSGVVVVKRNSKAIKTDGNVTRTFVGQGETFPEVLQDVRAKIKENPPLKGTK